MVLQERRCWTTENKSEFCDVGGKGHSEGEDTNQENVEEDDVDNVSGEIVNTPLQTHRKRSRHQREIERSKTKSHWRECRNYIEEI